jgi:predicted PurR-regulated permease PerM
MVCLLVAAVKLGRDLLIPLAFGLLFAVLLSGLVEKLRRWGVPRVVGATVLMLVIALAGAGLVGALSAPAEQWFARAPHLLTKVQQRVRPLQSVFSRMDELARRAGDLTQTPAGKPAAPATAVTGQATLDLITGTGKAAIGVLMCAALALLLLSAGPAACARTTAALTARWRARKVLRLIHAVRHEVSRYYGTLALVNVAFGTATALLMWLVGMPNPMLWGAVAGMLNFIPYLGGALTVTILAIVGLVSLDRIADTLLACGGFLVLAGIEGHVVEPMFIGRRLALNPIAVLVALWFGGWLWGALGVAFAMPTLVAAKVVATHSDGGKSFVRFLGPLRAAKTAKKEV